MCSIVEVSENTPVVPTLVAETLMIETVPDAPSFYVNEVEVEEVRVSQVETVETVEVEAEAEAEAVINSNDSSQNTVDSLIIEDNFKYIRNGMDLTKYAMDFINDESSYHETMKSYTTEDTLSLFILVNGLVSAAGCFEKDSTLHEYLRNDTSPKFYYSICDWVTDYYHTSVSITKLLDSVYIGEDLVPIWMVLVDAKESDDILHDYKAIIIPNNIPIINKLVAGLSLTILIACVLVPLTICFI